MIPFLFIILFTFSAVNADAARCRAYLTEEESGLVKESRSLVRDVDLRTLPETVADIEATDCPTIHALIFDAMARTYDRINRENGISGQRKKDYLYTKIKLNAAYLQLTGGSFQGDGDSLNRRIRYLLKEYLGPEVLEHPAFFQEVKELLE